MHEYIKFKIETMNRYQGKVHKKENWNSIPTDCSLAGRLTALADYTKRTLPLRAAEISIRLLSALPLLVAADAMASTILTARQLLTSFL